MDDNGNLTDMMRRFQDGEENALAGIYEAVSNGMINYIYGLTRDRALSEDTLQEVFVRLYRVRHTYIRGNPVKPWLYAIARHVAIDVMRKRRREVCDGESLIDGAVDRRSNDGHTQVLFEEVLKKIPESLREAFVLTKVIGLSAREAAASIGTTEGAIKVKVFRAMKALNIFLV